MRDPGERLLFQEKVTTYVLHGGDLLSVDSHLSFITLIEPILSYTDTAWGELKVCSGQIQLCVVRISMRSW